MIVFNKKVRSFIPRHMSSFSKSISRSVTTKNAINDINDINGAKVIILTGPTAVGKSSVAKRICSIVDAEIVIADSVQVYKYLDIGANKPTKKDQEDIKHHLVDVELPNKQLSAGDFCNIAKIAIFICGCFVNIIEIPPKSRKPGK